MARTITRPQAIALRTAFVYTGEVPPSGTVTDGRYLVDGRPNTLAVLARLGLVETVTEVVGIDREEITHHVLTRAGELIRATLHGSTLPTLDHVAYVVQQEADRAALDGRYEPNVPGARTLHEARPLMIEGKQVTVTITGKGTRAYLYVGTTWLYSGPVPEELRFRHEVNAWAARVALADPAPWAQVGARIGTSLGHGTVTGRDIWADGTYTIAYRLDDDGRPSVTADNEWLITANSEHLRRLCALCDTVGDSDDDPEYPARFSRFGKYLCGFCSHAHQGRYVARTMAGRPEDGWGIFDREAIDWTTIRMTEEDATARAEELNYRTPAAFETARPVLSCGHGAVCLSADGTTCTRCAAEGSTEPQEAAHAPATVYVTTEGGERIEYAHVPNGDPVRVAHFLAAARAVPTFRDVATAR